MKKKLKFLLFILHIIISINLCAQVGIGISTPHESSDLHLGNIDKTLIINKVENINNIKNPVDGMFFFDAVEKCFRGYANNAFTDCFGGVSSDPIVKASGPGFKGTFDRGKSLDATFEVTVTNNTFRPVDLNFNLADLSINVSDIIVTEVYISGSTNKTTKDINVNFAAGASKTIVYKLSGIPNAPYKEIQGNWNKIVLSYDDIQEINFPIDCTNGNWVNTITPLAFNGLMNNEIYNGTYIINYNYDATGHTFPSWSETIDGLTLSISSTEGSNKGQFSFTLSGQYTGNDNGSVTFNLFGKCPVTIGIEKSCKQILKSYTTLSSGVYKIDIDGNGPSLPMDAYCDMTTDGGGWTLILNYNHKANTSPGLTVYYTSLPLLGNSQLLSNSDVTEVGTKYWGQAHKDLFKNIPMSEMRFYGNINTPKKIIHFKTSLSSIISNYKNGVINLSGVQNSFTALSGHNAELPKVADGFSNSLTDHTFYSYGGKHWNINSNHLYRGRWEVDNYKTVDDPNNNSATHHQVWVR